MLEFVSLRAKMYSVKCKEKNLDMKKAKGVKRSVIKQSLQHAQYRNALFNNERYYHINKGFRSYNHELFSIKQNKVSLSGYDDKRYILEDKITTLPHGHFKTL